MGPWPSECDNPRLQPATENEESGGTESGAALVTAGSIMDDSNDEEGMDDIIVGFQFLNENSLTQGVRSLRHGFCSTVNPLWMCFTTNSYFKTSETRDEAWLFTARQE